MFNGILEDTIFEFMLDDDLNELESYDRTLLDSVLETNDIDLDKCDDDDCDDSDDLFDSDDDDEDDDEDDEDDDDDIDSILDDVEGTEIYDQYSNDYRKYY